MESLGLTHRLRFHLCGSGPCLVGDYTFYNVVCQGMGFDEEVRLVANVKLTQFHYPLGDLSKGINLLHRLSQGLIR